MKQLYTDDFDRTCGQTLHMFDLVCWTEGWGVMWGISGRPDTPHAPIADQLSRYYDESV